ncbi:hypothetical protein PV08_05816 [Exophiala spinifera]|uniref:Uncharacterized protein n=1 Tax=Exophiala spinifera TaxID=91928 RepID=A0A0D1YL38_9EURO|nr:uncharacterized protein PV08_05816 [Exophiala spinifera]KIW15766.1 hypothetical protein PV08_05816 [Exophiala spinifera]
MEVSSSTTKRRATKKTTTSNSLTQHTIWLYVPSMLLVLCRLLLANAALDLDTYFALTLSVLLLSRLLSVFALRAKTSPSSSSWHGESEPGVRGDLLILLSEDRWIRMRGLVDDLKAVTSGSWLSTPSSKYGVTSSFSFSTRMVLDIVEWTSRLLVYVASIVLANAPDADKMLIVTYAVLSHVTLALYNDNNNNNSNTGGTGNPLIMNGRQVKVSAGPNSVKRYSRRLAMARELTREMGRSDFALKLGMINADEVDDRGTVKDELVTM